MTLAFACVELRPRLTWAPAPVIQAVEPNGFRVLYVTFVADTDLRDVALQVSSSIRSFIEIAPSSFTNVAAGQSRSLRVAVMVPPSIHSGLSISGWLQIRTGRRVLDPLEVQLRIVPSTPEGTLKSLGFALEARDPTAYAAQFLPERQQDERKLFAQQSEVALDTLARTLQTAERVSLSDDGTIAEYHLVLLLQRNRVETTIQLGLDRRDGIWRVLRF